MDTSPDTPPYSRTRTGAGLLFTAGILGRTEVGLADGFRAQLETALESLEGLLVAQGCGLADVVRLVCYLTDGDQLDVLNDVFTQWFAEPRPTRTTVVVTAVPGGALVELEATAALGS